MTSSRGKRLVIFGCGYIGGEVARQAIARGIPVTALTRNEEKAAALRTAGVEVVVADLASSDWHGRIGGGAEWVLNAVSSGGGGLEGYRRSYREGMRSIVTWLRDRGAAETIVYTSSTSVYPQDGGVCVDETASTAGANERAEVLLDAERLLSDAVADPRARVGRRCFILRLAGIYGPGRHHLLEQIRGGVVAGRGEHRLNLAHRDDICAAIRAAFEAPESVTGGIFNVADDAPAPKAEVAAWLADRLRVPRPVFTGEPASGRRAVTPDRVIANAKMKGALGWRPRFPSFRDGYENILSQGEE